MKSAIFIILLMILTSENGHSNGLRMFQTVILDCHPASTHYGRARLFRSLARKIEAIFNVAEVSVKTTDDGKLPVNRVVSKLLDSYSDGADVFITRRDGALHLIENMPRGKKTFGSSDSKHLAQQQHGDGHVFSLRQDGLYYGTYSAEPGLIEEYAKLPFPNSYYQDLLNDMTMLIKVEHVSGNSRTLSKATERLLQGEDIHLLKLLEVRDEVALYKNDTLLDIFKSIYYESLERKGVKDIPKLEAIDIKIAELGLQRSSGNRQYLNFNSHYTWDRTEISHYLLGETRKLGADSIARLRIMANSDPKLQRALDEILKGTDIPNKKLSVVYRMSRTEFEQALTEVSSVFHMLDIDSSVPTRMPTMDKEQQVNKFLKEVAKRKNKVLHQYFDAVVFNWDNRFRTGKHYLDRIRFMEDLISAKKQNTYRRWTVREALEDLGIGVDEYLNYTSNIEGELSLDTLSSIVMSINTNFEASAAQKFTAMFLDLHQDVAIVKDVNGAAKKIEVVGVEVE